MIIKKLIRLIIRLVIILAIIAAVLIALLKMNIIHLDPSVQLPDFLKSLLSSLDISLQN